MKELFKRIVNLIKPCLSYEIIGIIFTILYTVAVFASPIVSRYLIDEVIPSKSVNKLYIGLGIFFIVCISQPIIGCFKDLIFLNITEKITLNIRENMFFKVLHAPMKLFDSISKGEIISRIINDGRSASDFISNIFVVLIKNIILIVMIISGMYLMSYQITSIVVVLFIAYFLINWRMSKKFKLLSLNVQKNYDSICILVNQMSDSILTIKSFLVEEQIEKNYKKTLLKTYNDNKKIASLSILLNNLSNIVVVFSLAIIYGLGTLSVMKGTMTLGTVIAMGLYFQMLIQPVYELLGNNIQFQRNIPIFDRIYEFLNIDDEHKSKNYEENICGGIIVKNLYFSYKDGVNVLNGINLRIPSKGLYALVGRSGSGKSTLVKLLMGLYKPVSGNIYISGKDINELPVNVLRWNISFVSQDIELFNQSIIDNIRCGNLNASNQEIENICKKVKIHDKIIGLPDGYDNIVTERINLSGGEKQRIAIARALLKNPSIFIFDEPTSALDPENEGIIKGVLEEISKERTVIVIAHELSTIVNADKIFVFDKGNIVESGTHNSLINDNSIYANFVYNLEVTNF